MKDEPAEQTSPDLKPAIRMLSWFTVCYGISFVGYLGSSQGFWFWYKTLRRPDWDAPTWAYTPVWTISYGLLAWASWQVWVSPSGRGRSWALTFLFLLLAIAGFWPWLFFAWHAVGASAILGFAMLFANLAVTISFWKLSSYAGKLTLFSLLWVAFLATLTVVEWKANRP